VTTIDKDPMAPYSTFQRLVFDRPATGVLRVAMNNPGRLNAADARMHQELVEVWRIADADESVRAIIITGAGGVFSAGGDFSIVETAIRDFQVRARLWKEAKDLVYNLLSCSKPIVSAMQGVAVGAGLVCGLLADVSVAGRKLKIVDGHTRLGVAAGDHAALIWPLLCGMAKAKYYLLLCEPISGEEAERIGLVSVAVDDDLVAEKAVELARKLAAGSMSAISWTKYSLNNWLRSAGPAFDASLALEFLGFSGPDAAEGLASHLEKRKPDFFT
jgi:enoyl-CoA hydratase